jgi:hypothetical protein
MMAKRTGGTAAKRRQRDLATMAAQSIAADELDDVVFSWILAREDELTADVAAGILREHELSVVRSLLRLILSPNVRMPLSRLQ